MVDRPRHPPNVAVMNVTLILNPEVEFRTFVLALSVSVDALAD